MNPKHDMKLGQITLPNGETVFAVLHADGRVTPLRGAANWNEARTMFAAIPRWHVHVMVTEHLTGDDIANVTVTLDAWDDQQARAIARGLFDQDVYQVDTQEIELAQ